MPKKSRDKSEGRDSLVSQSNQDNQLMGSEYSNLDSSNLNGAPSSNCGMIVCANGTNLQQPLNGNSSTGHTNLTSIKQEQLDNQQVTSSNSLKQNPTSTVDNYNEPFSISNSLTNHDHHNGNLNGNGILNNNQTSVPNGTLNGVGHTNDLYELIMNIEQAHNLHCEYDDELSLALKKKGSISGNCSTSSDSYNSSTSTNGSPIICNNNNIFLINIRQQTTNCMSPFAHSSASSTSSLSNSTVSSSAGELSPLGGSGQCSASSPDSGEQHRLMLWQRFSTLQTPSIHRIVEFAKRVPGFLDLSQDDQLILIKLGFFECWIVHMSKWYNSLEGTLTFSCGSVVNAQQLQVIFDVSDSLIKLL